MIKTKEIIDFLGNDVISVFGSIEHSQIEYLRAPEYTLDWINSSRDDKQTIAENTKAKVIIADGDVDYLAKMKSRNMVLIKVKNPKLAIAKIANEFFVVKIEPKIAQSAIVHPEAKIGKNVFIGSNASIGKCKIGDDVAIFPNSVINDNVEIGNHVIIQSGAIIGTDGLGCERQGDGTLVKFPHFGGISISNNVEIGANCQIARGVFTNTIIGEGTKINGLCFIAHNCIIGKNVLITGNSMLAGSVKVNDNVTIYSNVIVREHRIIGKGATIGMGAVVTKNIPAGETWIGNPAKRMEK
jgi:UDP-3-O-[3-hydroxymyristoyl] glucosamine N-acyltransferase